MHNPEEFLIANVLAGKAKPEEIRKVISWFATEKGQAYLSAYMDKDYEKNGLPARHHLKASTWQKICRQINCFRWIEKTFMLRVAAVMIPVLLLLGAGTVINHYVDLFGTASISRIELKAGMKRTLQLPDGSTVYLGPGSTLTYPERFGLFRRTVHFSGDAYFDINHQHYRPFIIQSGDVSVQVLGTDFNLMSDSSSSHVSLRLDHGLVRLQSSTGSECYVKQGENVVYDKAHKQFYREKPDNSASYIDWKKGVMQFNNASLEKVLKYVSSTYNVRFRITVPDLKSYRYTIRWDNAPLETVLQDMAMITPIRFQRRGNLIFVK